MRVCATRGRCVSGAAALFFGTARYPRLMFCLSCLYQDSGSGLNAGLSLFYCLLQALISLACRTATNSMTLRRCCTSACNMGKSMRFRTEHYCVSLDAFRQTQVFPCPSLAQTSLQFPHAFISFATLAGGGASSLLSMFSFCRRASSGAGKVVAGICTPLVLSALQNGAAFWCSGLWTPAASAPGAPALALYTCLDNRDRTRSALFSTAAGRTPLCCCRDACGTTPTLLMQPMLTCSKMEAGR